MEVGVTLGFCSKDAWEAYGTWETQGPIEAALLQTLLALPISPAPPSTCGKAGVRLAPCALRSVGGRPCAPPGTWRRPLGHSPHTQPPGPFISITDTRDCRPDALEKSQHFSMNLSRAALSAPRHRRPSVLERNIDRAGSRSRPTSVPRPCARPRANCSRSGVIDPTREEPSMDH